MRRRFWRKQQVDINYDFYVMRDTKGADGKGVENTQRIS